MVKMGAHVDQTDPIAEARARGAGLSQFFLGDPQAWKGPQVAYPGGAAALKADAEAAANPEKPTSYSSNGSSSSSDSNGSSASSSSSDSAPAEGTLASDEALAALREKLTGN